MCKYCDDDRIIGQGAIWLEKKGTIACINAKNEFVYIIHPYRGKKGEYKANMGWKNQRDKNGHWEDVCPECAGV